VRWKVALTVPVIVAAGLAATASSTPPVVVDTVAQAEEVSAPGGVGLIPGEPREAEPPRSTEGEPETDPLAQLPPEAIEAAGGMAVLGDGPLAIPELVFYAYRAAEMQLNIDEPECGLPWHLLAAIGRLGSRHADGGRTNVVGTLTTPSVTPDGRIGPMRLSPAVWERFAKDGNADGATDPQNVFDSTLAAGAWMCAEGGRLREPEGEARAVALFDPSPQYLANVRAWSAAYAKAAEVAPADLAPLPARPIPVDVAASAPVVAQSTGTSPAEQPEATPPAEQPPAPQSEDAQPEDAQGTGAEPAPAAPPQPAAPALPELPELPCLVPTFCE